MTRTTLTMLGYLLLASSAAFAGGQHHSFHSSSSSSTPKAPLMKVAPLFTNQKQQLLKVAPRFSGQSPLTMVKVAPNKNLWMSICTPHNKNHKSLDPQRPDDRVLVPTPNVTATQTNLIAIKPDPMTKGTPVVRDHTVTKPTLPPDYSNPPTVTGGAEWHFTNPFGFQGTLQPHTSDNRTPSHYDRSNHHTLPEPWMPNTQGPANSR